ncbi:MAG: DUF5985 family protein [Gemmatimonadaceae bacterium]
MRSVVAFLFGMLAMACGTVSVFFIRFWTETRDRVFLFLAIAFALFAVERAAALTTFDAAGGPIWPYLLRLAGFLLIIVGLIDKNRDA